MVDKVFIHPSAISETDRIKDTLDEDAKMIDAMLIIFFISAYKRA